MATDGAHPHEAELLPDERAMIVERLDELEDDESHLSVEEAADELRIDLK